MNGLLRAERGTDNTAVHPETSNTTDNKSSTPPIHDFKSHLTDSGMDWTRRELELHSPVQRLKSSSVLPRVPHEAAWGNLEGGRDDWTRHEPRPIETVQRKATDQPILRSKAPSLPKTAQPNTSTDVTRAFPQDTRSKMETAFNTDFSDVTLHEGPQATDMAAQAYTQGNQIHFAPDRYDPSSQSGRKLLGHELAHVVQ